jgi:putative NIF3 family GTP cyclohydrolase 1 type 2
VIHQAELIAKLDTFFSVSAFDESGAVQYFPPGYASIFEQFAAPGFLQGSWNGLMLDNTSTIDRVYLIVFPAQDVLDTIIAREVERGAPGALIFSHHMADYQESGPGFAYITEEQLDELREHAISYYHCHAPLDCHPEISTSTALAAALKVREPQRFGPYLGGLAGVYGKVGPIGFHEFATRVAAATHLPYLRYSAIRNNGCPVQQVGIVTGRGGEPEFIRAALDAGCDTFVTGEWWLFGPGDTRMRHREQMHDFLVSADINLIGTSHYASEAVVMRDLMPGWFNENAPGVEPIFVPQNDPWR